MRAKSPASHAARSAFFVAVAVVLVLTVAAGAGLFYMMGHLQAGTSTLSTTVASSSSEVNSTSFSASTSTVSANSTLATMTVIIPDGATYQVSSSFDCVAGHFAQPFNVTATSSLEGGISAGSPGVTLYVSTAQEAQTTVQGHPAAWAYSSGLTNSTSFSIVLSPGSYVVWIEGADMGCGATIVEPLEELTTVTVTQAVALTPGA
jgi:hypothetical protein